MSTRQYASTFRAFGDWLGRRARPPAPLGDLYTERAAIRSASPNRLRCSNPASATAVITTASAIVPSTNLELRHPPLARGVGLLDEQPL